MTILIPNILGSKVYPFCLLFCFRTSFARSCTWHVTRSWLRKREKRQKKREKAGVSASSEEKRRREEERKGCEELHEAASGIERGFGTTTSVLPPVAAEQAQEGEARAE